MTTRVVFDQRALDTLFLSPDGPSGKLLAKAAVKIERSAKRACAVDTGRLRSSVAHELGRDERGLVARIGTDVTYGIYVELGTRRMRAQPFLRPALDSIRGGI